jgi:quinol monooxygenase YgiN
MIVAIGDIYTRIPDRERVVALMRATEARVREEPGCIRCCFAETLDDPGHFLLVEHWRDRTALDAHYRSEAFAAYQEQITALLVRTSDLELFEVSAALAPVDLASIEPPQEG